MPEQRNPFERLIQIPGPNPILRRGGPGEWDECLIEACDILKDYDTYTLYYHGTPMDTERWPSSGYRIGVATARHPLGPWTKHEGNPILDLGPEGSWEDQHVACAFVLKEGVDRYLMWYSGYRERWGVGLATASSPLGPWTKHPGNPVLPHFGYVGGVVKVDGRYRMYNEHPIGQTGPDYGPISLATAEEPEGPWEPYEGDPVLPAGEWGAWDDGGYSEAKVLYREGVTHLFYGGAKLHPTRILSEESIGHAYSFDGVHFTKNPLNPVAPRERNPNAAAFAEVHSLVEPPFVYCYHTLRYITAERPNVEEIGVQALAFQQPFCLSMPLLLRDALAPGEATGLEECPPLCLEHVRAGSLTLECSADAGGSTLLRLGIRASSNGLDYDTEDVASHGMRSAPGGIARCTYPLPEGIAYAKVWVANRGAGQPVKDVGVTATLKG